MTRREHVSPLPGVTWVPGDLRASTLPAGLPSRADVVVHLAQSPHYRAFPAGALDVFDVNVGSTARLLDWSRRAGVQQFILASSGGVSGGQPQSFYLASKASAEALAESYARVFGVLALRFFFVYGPGQKPTMLVPRLIDAIRGHRAVPLSGHDGPRLNPIHVDDAVRAIETAIERRTVGRIDIAGPEVLTVRQMCESIAARLGRAAEYACNLDEAPADLIGDITIMRADLERPTRRFDEGVAGMIAVQEESVR
jgi:UDP-glucose 4-epimerase